FSPVHDIQRVFHSLGWAGTIGISVGLALGSLAVAAVVVVNWPADHFKEGERPAFWAQRHPVVRALGIAAKNLGGLILVLLGCIMALPGVPGQGLLLILIGLTLVNFPGKRRIERALIRRPSVLKVVNSVRARFGHGPL